MNKFDNIIIGFGKGGKTLAGDLAKRGQKVALIEKSKMMYGGTCINKACIPTKKLENEASVIRSQNLSDFEELKAKYENAINNKEVLITKLRGANYNKLNSNENITIFDGMASFVDEKTVEIIDENGEKILLKAERIFINTGSLSYIPSIKGVDDKSIVFDSESLMNLKDLPRKMTIIGAGFIGLEFAGIYSSFGSDVTVLNTQNDILMNEDKDDADEVSSILSKRGVKILNNISINEIVKVGQNAKVLYMQDGVEKSIESDIVLVATGRKANTEGLNLDKAGVELDARGFVKVNERLETSTKNIFALGDVNGGPQFTYISLDDYRIVANNLFADKTRSTLDRNNVPRAMFIDPAFSRVGLNVKEAKAKGHDVLVAKMATDAIPRAKQIGKTDGFIKVVIDKHSQEILGASMICEESSEIIHLIQLAMDLGAKYTYLRDRIYAHPTMTEALNEVLSDAMITQA